MTVYMQSTLELRAGDRGAFHATMKEIVAVVEAEGWLLIAAFEQITGRLHTAIDIWRLPDLESYARGLAALRGHAGFPEMARVLADAIERETVVIGVRAAWLPDGR